MLWSGRRTTIKTPREILFMTNVLFIKRAILETKPCCRRAGHAFSFKKSRSEAKHKLLEIKWQFYDAQRSQRKQRPSANNSYPGKCIVKFSSIKAYVPGNIKLRMRDADKDAGFMANGGGWAVKSFQPIPERSAFNAFSNCMRCAYKTRCSVKSEQLYFLHKVVWSPVKNTKQSWSSFPQSSKNNKTKIVDREKFDYSLFSLHDVHLLILIKFNFLRRFNS